jgi:hypothetical protein
MIEEELSRPDLIYIKTEYVMDELIKLKIKHENDSKATKIIDSIIETSTYIKINIPLFIEQSILGISQNIVWKIS